MKRLLLGAIVALLAVAPAAGACPKTTLADVEAEVMCPVCGTPLGLAIESPQAQRERELIRRLVDGCRSKDQVKAVLVREYGDDVLALPPGEGFDLAAYLAPALVLLLAGGAVGASALRWRRSRRRKSKRASGTPPGAGVAERLQTDLDRYEL